MDLLAALRKRLEVPVNVATDEELNHLLEVAANALTPWLIPDPEPYRANVDEVTVQLAVKLYDTGSRGVSSMSPDGEWMAPAPSASMGLIRSVLGGLGPALSMGGVSV